jgi:hypothetical protein
MTGMGTEFSTPTMPAPMRKALSGLKVARIGMEMAYAIATTPAPMNRDRQTVMAAPLPLEEENPGAGAPEVATTAMATASPTWKIAVPMNGVRWKATAARTLTETACPTMKLSAPRTQARPSASAARTRGREIETGMACPTT